MLKFHKLALISVLIVAIAAIAALGIIAAATAPSVDISYINLSYKVNTELKYAVKAENIPADATVTVSVNVGSPTSSKVREAVFQGITVIEGAEYMVFGLTVQADEFAVDMYATPRVVRGSSVVTAGETAKDSIVEYAVRTKDKIADPTDDVYILVDTMLDYGAAVQLYFNTNTDRLANADFHSVKIVNGKLDDGFSSGYFIAGEQVIATATVQQGYGVEKWTNSTGETVGEAVRLLTTAPARNETYTASIVKSNENISYVLDGGRLPEGEWNEYPADADFTLPIPTKDGYVFSGWYTSSDFNLDGNLTKIPAGSTEYYTVYAKWSKIAIAQDSAAIKSKVSTLCFVYDSADLYGGNGNDITLENGVFVWTQGSVKTSQLTMYKSITDTVGDGMVFTYEIDMAKKANTPIFPFKLRLRRAGINETIDILHVRDNGSVELNGGGEITTLTEQIQTIRVAVDFNTGMRTAYDEEGQVITASKMPIPASVTSYAEWYNLLTSQCWQLYAEGKPASGTAAVLIDRIDIHIGNSAVRGSGTPVTIVDKAGEKNYKIVYDADSAVAKDAADNLAAYIASLGLKTPSVISDTASASTYEIVVGEAAREGASELATYLAAKKATLPENHWWAFMYKGGKLYILATSEKGYLGAINTVSGSYTRNGEIVVSSELKTAVGMSEDDILIESLVDPNPHDAYMSYDVPSNYFDGYSNPFGVKESELKTMTLKYVNSSTYRISYLDVASGGTYSVDIVKKRWGCWMLGQMVYTDKNGKANYITSSSTDYEFVLSCANEANITFRGGNHADYTMGDAWDANDTTKSNDRLLDMTFYDGKTGAKITLPTSTSQSVTMTGVRIVMHTNIYEQEYAQENVLMNVCKDYLINGFDVFCNSNLYMTQQVRFSGQSYSCMLPIAKAYGNNALYYNRDGNVEYLKTVQNGGSDGIHRGHNAALVDLWGDNYPQYHMQVEILNPDVQMIKSNPSTGYASFRNMLGGGSNKVYFSLGSAGLTLEHGTELNFLSRWSFYIDEDFTPPTTEPDAWVGNP